VTDGRIVDRKTSKTMNISLTPELHQAVWRRVSSGAYTSASEVVREALRLLDRVSEQEAEAASRRPDLTMRQWREVRHALIQGEAALVTERAQDLDDLFAAGVAMMKARLAREMPDTSERERDKHLAQWLRERMGTMEAEGVGRPVAPERMRRILGG